MTSTERTYRVSYRYCEDMTGTAPRSALVTLMVPDGEAAPDELADVLMAEITRAENVTEGALSYVDRDAVVGVRVHVGGDGLPGTLLDGRPIKGRGFCVMCGAGNTDACLPSCPNNSPTYWED